jgi:hypothetical protein
MWKVHLWRCGKSFCSKLRRHCHWCHVFFAYAWLQSRTRTHITLIDAPGSHPEQAIKRPATPGRPLVNISY